MAIIVTNQSHIGKGYFTYDDYTNRVNELRRKLCNKDANIDAIYCCPHIKSDGCNCKKPLPGLLGKAQRDYDLHLPSCYVIGDMGSSDIVMAKSVGAYGVLVRTGAGEGSLTTYRSTWADHTADRVADNVLDAARWIRNVCGWKD